MNDKALGWLTGACLHKASCLAAPQQGSRWRRMCPSSPDGRRPPVNALCASPPATRIARTRPTAHVFTKNLKMSSASGAFRLAGAKPDDGNACARMRATTLLLMALPTACKNLALGTLAPT